MEQLRLQCVKQRTTKPLPFLTIRTYNPTYNCLTKEEVLEGIYANIDLLKKQNLAGDSTASALLKTYIKERIGKATETELIQSYINWSGDGHQSNIK